RDTDHQNRMIMRFHSPVHLLNRGSATAHANAHDGIAAKVATGRTQAVVLYRSNADVFSASTCRPSVPVQPFCKARIKARRRGGMAEQYVGKITEFADGDRRIIFAGDNEIGIFRHEGQFYAYSNFCLHQGGPACEGLTIAKVEERLLPDKTSQGLYFSESEMHFVCPWHGYEYDMKTGE